MTKLQPHMTVRAAHTEAFGMIQGIQEHAGEVRHLVQWEDDSTSWEAVQTLRSGLQVGQDVLHVPEGARTGFGTGTVLQTRPLPVGALHLVEFFTTSRRLWIPWTQLQPVQDVRALFSRGVQPPAAQAERFRLRQLAHALGAWYQNVQGLTHLNIDPLPHQLYLVQRILSSGHLNWLIADDVGLGKTVEVGLLLTALRERGLRRFLLIVPPTLTEQWQAEMREKFNLAEFMVFGNEFAPSDSAHWRAADMVIASIDSLKTPHNRERLLESGRWDAVVFDEAHRLSHEDRAGRTLTTARYQLALDVRTLTDNLILLSGTPHQGKENKFQSLLSLLRPGPEWAARFAQLELNPDLLGEMVIRNRKSQVVDASGRFIFNGKHVHPLPVSLSSEERDFDQALRAYLKAGFATAQGQGQTARGRIIGLVMTAYRKLAASSHAAIERALERRLVRLGHPQLTSAAIDEDHEETDFEQDEQQVFDAAGSAFFQGEEAHVVSLLNTLRALRGHDTKRQQFLNFIERGLRGNDPQANLLIFTEYRSTQEYLAEALRERYGAEHVQLIHGGQKHADRQAAIRAFEQGASFLISTEAGGEGLNLQRTCHVMVNYDLPWNPMRLVQRVGRLYRYGQSRTVEVYNLQVQGSLDEEILSLLYTRLEQVARTLMPLSEDYNPDGLQEDILGTMAAELDFEALMADVGRATTPERTHEELAAAIQRAQRGVEDRQRLLDHASGFDHRSLQGRLPLSEAHVQTFVDGMLAVMRIDVTERTHQGKVWRLRLPEAIERRLRQRGMMRVTFDHDTARNVAGTVLLDTTHPLVRLMIDEARTFTFGGQVACADVEGSDLLCALLRWQDATGVTVEQEYVALQRHADGSVTANTDAFSNWLLRPAESATLMATPAAETLEELEQILLHRLLDKKGVSPEMYVLTGAVWGHQGQGSA